MMLFIFKVLYKHKATYLFMLGYTLDKGQRQFNYKID